MLISIHALTRSATRLFPPNVERVYISIHALTRSATLDRFAFKRARQISIHALTRSATCAQHDSGSEGFYFNPRTHEECDGIVKGFNDLACTFQSTHSRGVRLRIVAIINEFMYKSTD